MAVALCNNHAYVMALQGRSRPPASAHGQILCSAPYQRDTARKLSTSIKCAVPWAL